MMPPNPLYHIHVSVSPEDDLVIEKVYSDPGKDKELLFIVDLTEKDAPDYDPVFGDHAEVVIEADEMRLVPGPDGNVVVVIGI